MNGATTKTPVTTNGNGHSKHEQNGVQIDSKFNPTTYYPDMKYSLLNIRERLSRSILHEFSEEEQKTRIELAASYRLAARFGWLESIYSHITARVNEPDGSHTILINPLGLNYEEITASSLIKIDYDGNVVHPGTVGDLFAVNKAGVVIHTALHKARPDCFAVNHNHDDNAAGLSATKAGLLELVQTTHVTGEIAYHDYEGIVVNTDEQKRLVADMGDKNILILRNHGVLTAGDSVAAAFYRMYLLTKASAIAVAAGAIAGTQSELIIPDEKLVTLSQRIAAKFSAHGMGILEYSSFMRLLDWDEQNGKSIYPSYRL